MSSQPLRGCCAPSCGCSAPTWEVPTTFIYGVDDIMDYRAGLKAAKLMRTPVEVLLIQEVQ